MGGVIYIPHTLEPLKKLGLDSHTDIKFAQKLHARSVQCACKLVSTRRALENFSVLRLLSNLRQGLLLVTLTIPIDFLLHLSEALNGGCPRCAFEPVNRVCMLPDNFIGVEAILCLLRRMAFKYRQHSAELGIKVQVQKDFWCLSVTPIATIGLFPLRSCKMPFANALTTAEKAHYSLQTKWKKVLKNDAPISNHFEKMLQKMENIELWDCLGSAEVQCFVSLWCNVNFAEQCPGGEAPFISNASAS
eukprot:1139774-Pelagomonas_calceolata.AAC.1